MSIYYEWYDFKVGNIIYCPGCAMEIVSVDDKSQEIINAINAVGGDLDKFDPRLF